MHLAMYNVGFSQYFKILAFACNIVSWGGGHLQTDTHTNTNQWSENKLISSEHFISIYISTNKLGRGGPNRELKVEITNW